VKYKQAIVKMFFMSQGLPAPVFELQYIPDRKFRLDIAWPNLYAPESGGVGIEVCGGIWTGLHSHASGKGIKRDMEKNNLSLLNKWLILRCEPSDLCTMDMVRMVKALQIMSRMMA